MASKKQSTGEMISSVVFFVVGTLLSTEGLSRLNSDHFSGAAGILGGLLSILAAFRFRVQRAYEKWWK